MFGSLGSLGEHCLDLPTNLCSIGSLATCLVRSVLRENTVDLPTYLSSIGSLATSLVRAGLDSGLLFVEFEICCLADWQRVWTIWIVRFPGRRTLLHT